MPFEDLGEPLAAFGGNGRVVHDHEDFGIDRFDGTFLGIGFGHGAGGAVGLELAAGRFLLSGFRGDRGCAKEAFGVRGRFGGLGIRGGSGIRVRATEEPLSAGGVRGLLLHGSGGCGIRVAAEEALGARRGGRGCAAGRFGCFGRGGGGLRRFRRGWRVRFGRAAGGGVFQYFTDTIQEAHGLHAFHEEESIRRTAQR